MPRTVISLSEQEKRWLDQQAHRENVPMTEIVRRALRCYRERQPLPDKDFLQLLEETSGIWRHGDGLEYQLKLREEWDR